MRFNLLVLEKQRSSKVEGPDLRLARESTLGELRSVLFGGHQTSLMMMPKKRRIHLVVMRG